MIGEVGIAGISISWGAATDVGLTRSVNEDAVLARPPVFLVADGMGGHSAGDVASQMVVDEFGHLSETAPPLSEIDRLLRSVNNAIIDAGLATVPPTSMGTTAVALILVDNGGTTSWLVVNIGDSRAYVLAEDTLAQVSTDHSYVQSLVEAGEITGADARRHPQRNVVTRAVGVDAHLDPDYWLRAPREGERFLLCSDGLTGEVDDDAIGEVLRTHAEPAAAAQRLIDLALESGGRDNVSVLVVDVVAVDAAVREPLLSDTAPSGVPTVEHRAVGGPGSRGSTPGAPLIEAVPSLAEIAGRAGPTTDEGSPDDVDTDPAEEVARG